MNTLAHSPVVERLLRDASSSVSETIDLRTARNAQVKWASIPLVHRLQKIRNLRSGIAAHGRRLAEASAQIRGRPIAECLTSEVLPLADSCRFLENHALRILEPRVLSGWGLPLWLSGITMTLQREPRGVVLIIAPGNYPLFLAGVQTLQALAAGNAVFLKPSPGTSQVAKELQALICEAGVDPQLFTLLPESIEAAQSAILSRPDHIVFTGSAQTGQHILSAAAPLLISTTLELGGSDAVIVRADADLDLAAKALRFGLLLNEGRTCMAPRRVLTHASVSQELEIRLIHQLSQQRCAASDTGPASGDPRTRQRVREALTGGGRLVYGCHPDTTPWQGPWILSDVSPDDSLLREETFAPLLVFVTVANDAEAVRVANDSSYGLSASVFTRDETAGQHLAQSLHVGAVTINDLILPTADGRVPFGGRKRSGFGVTRGEEGLLQMTNVKVISQTKSRWRPAFDPTRPGDELLFSTYLEAAHGNGLFHRLKAIWALIQLLVRRI